MIKYYTKEWQDECVRRINSDPKFELEAKKLNGVFVFRIYDGPDGKDRLMSWTYKQGKIVDTDYQSQQAPWQELRNTPFNNAWMSRCTTNYAMMASLNKGDIAPMRALASPQYKIEGNKVTLMQLMKPLNLWNQICSTVETVYEYTSEDSESAASAQPEAAEKPQEG
jgi:hypothetical protein